MAWQKRHNRASVKLHRMSTRQLLEIPKWVKWKLMSRTAAQPLEIERILTLPSCQSVVRFRTAAFERKIRVRFLYYCTLLNLYFSQSQLLHIMFLIEPSAPPGWRKIVSR